jgi:hypothetical protein
MICTICNLGNLVPIWYGYPTPTELRLAVEEKIVLGGMKEKEYTHYCNYCQDTYPMSER